MRRRSAICLVSSTAVILALWGCRRNPDTATIDAAKPNAAVSDTAISDTVTLGKSSLRQGAALILTASLNPEELLSSPPMHTAADEQANLRADIPCFRSISADFQERLPKLMQNLDTLDHNLKGLPNHPSTTGSVTDQQVKDALGYIRVMHIAELSIESPDSLADDSDFKFESNLITLANQQIRMLPLDAQKMIVKNLQEAEPAMLKHYERFLSSQCHWDAP